MFYIFKYYLNLKKVTLPKTKNQTLIQYKIMSERLIEFVEHGKPNKDIIKTSTYPIEQKIYEKYAIKNPITGEW